MQLFHKELYQERYCVVDRSNQNADIFDGVLYSDQDSIEVVYDGIKDMISQFAYYELNKYFGITLEQYLNLNMRVARILIEIASEILKDKEKAASKAMNEVEKARESIET